MIYCVDLRFNRFKRYWNSCNLRCFSVNINSEGLLLYTLVQKIIPFCVILTNQRAIARGVWGFARGPRADPKIFPWNKPTTCDEHVKMSTFSKKACRKVHLFPEICAKNPDFSQKAHEKVHFHCFVDKHPPSENETWLRAWTELTCVLCRDKV